MISEFLDYFQTAVILTFSQASTVLKHHFNMKLNEPCCEKKGLLPMQKRAQISFAVTDQCLCFRYRDSAIPLLDKSEISSF